MHYEVIKYKIIEKLNKVNILNKQRTIDTLEGVQELAW